MTLRIFKCVSACLSSPCYIHIEDSVGNVLPPTVCPFAVESAGNDCVFKELK